jgi:hypothetical protein
MLHALILVLSLMALPFPVNANQDKQELCTANANQMLPVPIIEALAKGYPDWRPLRLEDLNADDQELWVKAKGKQCPGFTAGHFVSDNSLTYAVVLVNASHPKGYKLISISEISSERYKTSVILHEEQRDSKAIPLYPVVWAMPPGAYQDFYNPKRKLRTHRDGIVLERLEAWTVLYYWDKGKFAKFTLSD